MSEIEDAEIDPLKDARLQAHFREFGGKLPSNFAWLVSQKIVRERLSRAKSIARLQAAAIGVGLVAGLMLLFVLISAYLGTTNTIALDRFFFAGIAACGALLIIVVDDLIDVRKAKSR